MKNTILFGALLSILCAQTQAETQATTSTAANTSTPATQPATQGTQPATPIQAQPTTTSAPAQAATINCDYKIPASTKVIDQSLILNWSEKATAQAFNFDPTQLDNQMNSLKNCFTDPGWTGFNNALQKSGNIEAIKGQKLTVSSQVDGQATMDEVKDNQWKLTLPLQVVYQNDKEKVTQLLTIKLTVGRKINGDLGITQMIATPRANTAQTNNSTAPVSTTTNTNTKAATPSNDTTKAPVTTIPNNMPTTPSTGAPTIANPSAQPGNTPNNAPVNPQPNTTTSPNS